MDKISITNTILDIETDIGDRLRPEEEIIQTIVDKLNEVIDKLNTL